MWHLFKKKQEITLDWDSLSSFVRQKYDEQELQLEKIKKSILNQLVDLQNEIMQAVEDLQKAELVNPNISEKEKHFMIGNRSAYIQKVSFFVHSFPKLDVDAFLGNGILALSELSKSVQRPYHILQEFFSQESKKVSTLLGKTESLLKSVNVKNQWADVRDLLLDLDQVAKANEDFKQLGKMHEQEVQQALLSVKAAEKSYADFLASSSYSEFLSLENQVKRLKDQEVATKKSWSLCMSGLSPLLTRLDHDALEFQSQIAQTLQDSSIMFSWDQITFIDFIAYLKKSLVFAKLRDDKLKRVEQALQQIHLGQWKRHKEDFTQTGQLLVTLYLQFNKHPAIEILESLKRDQSLAKQLYDRIGAQKLSAPSNPEVLKSKIRQEFAKLQPQIILK